jgi:hypothetical protein
LRNRHTDTDSYPNADTDTDTDTDTDSYPDAYTHPDSDAHPDPRLQSLCRRYAIYGRPGREQCRRLLSMHGGRLVLVDRSVVLCSRHRFCLDPGLDPGDRFVLRRHTDADSYTDADADTDADTNPHTDSYSDAYSDADAHTDTEFRVQPVQGRDGQHQLEYRCDAKRRRRHDPGDHFGHAFA